MTRLTAGLAGLCAAVFLVIGAVAATNPVWSPDVSVERDLQAVPWGPLVPLMELTNWVAGVRQGLLALVLIVAVWFLNRRGSVTLAVGSLASAIDSAVKLLVHRPRPTGALVHVQGAYSGFSFPSGHATYFSWLALLLVLALAPRLGRIPLIIAWICAVGVIAIACLGRIWAGAHWPTDVEGGFLLAAGWSLLAYLVVPRLRILDRLDRFDRGRAAA